jgi:hypothetical protein
MFTMNEPSESPLALPFNEALVPSSFLAQLNSAAESQVRRELAAIANSALKSAIAAAKFVFDADSGMQVVFEGGVPKGAKLMYDLAGRGLPILVDGKTKRTIKIARLASFTRQRVSLLTGAAFLVFEAAHLISNYDNAKRLKRVERSVSELVHANQMEMTSRLEAIYRYSKELLHGGLENLSEDDRRELHRQCRDLIELRARWRYDFERRLREIKAAGPGWVTHVVFWRKEEAHRKTCDKRATEAVDALEIIQLMHFSLMLQMSLAGASGHIEEFRVLTLPDECTVWRNLLRYAEARSEEICGRSNPEEFRPFLGALEELVEFWLPDAWEKQRVKIA